MRRPPHFLPLRQREALGRFTQPRSPGAEGSFDVPALEACIRQTPEWKAHHHFAADVEALLSPRPHEPPEANWRRVVLDAPEQIALVFLRAAAPAGEPVLLGFPVRVQGWVLDAEPALVLGAGWEEVLPDLAEEPSPEAWRQAWREWSHPRSLPPAEVDACRLERVDHRLLVRAPHRLIERLRAGAAMRSSRRVGFWPAAAGCAAPPNSNSSRFEGDGIVSWFATEKCFQRRPLTRGGDNS